MLIFLCQFYRYVSMIIHAHIQDYVLRIMSETHKRMILSDGFVGCALRTPLHAIGDMVVTLPGDQLMLPGTADGQDLAMEFG